MKKVWKSVNIWWSYGQELGVLFFFDSQCIWYTIWELPTSISCIQTRAWISLTQNDKETCMCSYGLQRKAPIKNINCYCYGKVSEERNRESRRRFIELIIIIFIRLKISTSVQKISEAGCQRGTNTHQRWPPLQLSNIIQIHKCTKNIFKKKNTASTQADNSSCEEKKKIKSLVHNTQRKLC